MAYSSIDWLNIAGTLSASIIGGLIAAKIARQQINAAVQVEREKSRREISLELIDAMDSYVHIAYRGNDNDQLERQRLRRRIISLTALTMPEQFQSVQSHLDQVEAWWRNQRGKGVGYTVTEKFFKDLKQTIFNEIFQISINLTSIPGVNESDTT